MDTGTAVHAPVKRRRLSDDEPTTAGQRPSLACVYEGNVLCAKHRQLTSEGRLWRTLGKTPRCVLCLLSHPVEVALQTAIHYLHTNPRLSKWASMVLDVPSNKHEVFTVRTNHDLS